MAHFLLVALALSGASDSTRRLEETNARLAGQILDFTKNHGSDKRIYSPILCRKRDLYVYLPPGYDPALAYPFLLWIHGGFGDENTFIGTSAIVYLDRLIANGCFPPIIVACPDASVTGKDGYLSRHSFFVNGVSGRFEDHLVQEVIPFVMSHFSIRPEREAHIIDGYSGGGFPSMSLGIKHRDFFATVVSIAAPLNIRYSNVRGRYFEDFDPATFRWQTEYRPNQKVVRYYCGLVQLPARFFARPVFGDDPGMIQRVIPHNPADVLLSEDLQPGELDIFLAWGGKDNFNFDAQCESFVWLARQKGIEPTILFSPKADHSSEYCTWAQMRAFDWLASRVPGPVAIPVEEEGGEVTRSATDEEPVAIPSFSQPSPEGEGSRKDSNDDR